MLICISDYSEIAVKPLFHLPTGESPLILPMDCFHVVLFILSIYWLLNFGRKCFMHLIATSLANTSLPKAAVDLLVRTAFLGTIALLEGSFDIECIDNGLGLVLAVPIIGISLPRQDIALGCRDYIFLVCSTHDGSWFGFCEFFLNSCADVIFNYFLLPKKFLSGLGTLSWPWIINFPIVFVGRASVLV